MKKLLILLLFIPLTFACSDDVNDSRLTITNDAGENFRITRIAMDFGNNPNEFSDLNIQNGQSQTFTFKHNTWLGSGGISTNVNITHTCASQSWTRSYLFINGEFNYSSTTSLSFVYDPDCGSGTCDSVCLIPE